MSTPRLPSQKATKRPKSNDYKLGPSSKRPLYNPSMHAGRRSEPMSSNEEIGAITECDDLTDGEMYERLVESVGRADKMAQDVIDRAVGDVPVPKLDRSFILQYVIGTFVLHWNHPVRYVRGFTIRDFLNRTSVSTERGMQLISMCISASELGRTTMISTHITPFQAKVFDFYMR